MNYQDRLKLINELVKESETVESTVPEETFDVMTEEGFINQLNKLYKNCTIDKEYYLQQIELMKNTYPIMYNRIKEKLLMN